MVKKKFKWSDQEDLVFFADRSVSTTDPMKLSLVRSQRGHPRFEFRWWSKASARGFGILQKSWFEERSDMEDELGPISDGRADDDEDLDEDEYRTIEWSMSSVLRCR